MKAIIDILRDKKEINDDKRCARKTRWRPGTLRMVAQDFINLQRIRMNQETALATTSHAQIGGKIKKAGRRQTGRRDNDCFSNRKVLDPSPDLTSSSHACREAKRLLVIRFERLLGATGEEIKDRYEQVIGKRGNRGCRLRRKLID